MTSSPRCLQRESGGLVQCGSLHRGWPKRGEINFTSCNRWAFCCLLPGGWESSLLAGHKLFALGNLSTVIDTRYWFLLHCSMINAHLQQIWGLIKQNYVVLQRKDDLVIWASVCIQQNWRISSWHLFFHFFILLNFMGFYAFNYRPKYQCNFFGQLSVTKIAWSVHA